jgi:hypothetical protein
MERLEDLAGYLSKIPDCVMPRILERITVQMTWIPICTHSRPCKGDIPFLSIVPILMPGWRRVRIFHSGDVNEIVYTRVWLPFLHI